MSGPKELRVITPVERYRFTWQRNGVDIPGEHKSYYIVGPEDLGCKLTRRADYMTERRKAAGDTGVEANESN